MSSICLLRCLPASARVAALAALAWTLGAAGVGCDGLPPGSRCVDSDDCEPGEVCISVNGATRCLAVCMIGYASTCPASEGCSEEEPERVCLPHSPACTDHRSCWSGFACDRVAGQCVKCAGNGSDPYCRGPLAPDGLTATADNGQVALAWLPVDGATGYRVYMASEPGVNANSFEIASIADTNYTHTELDLSLTYYYRVSAENAWAEGPLSAEVSAAPRISAPVLLSALGDDEHVTLTWDPVPRADSYNVYWAMEPGVSVDSNRVSKVSSPFVHTSLDNNTTYYYAVTALDGPGESVLSNEVSARTVIDIGTELVAFDAEANDRFGRSVALAGDYAIVGAYHESGDADNPLPEAGAAYVFHRTGQNTWDQGTRLVAPDAQTLDQFGQSVALAGDYAIVGAWHEDGGDGDPIDSAGAAYVFHRTGDNTWDTGTKLVAPGARSLSYFGSSVALTSDYAIVGAYFAAAAYVFRRTGENTWDEGTKLVAPDPDLDAWFGRSVALAGDYAIVGAESAGVAYVFHRIGDDTWDWGTKLVAPGGQEFDFFGSAVALTSDHVIVGATGADGGGSAPRTHTGAAYVFRRTGENTWESEAKLAAPDAQAYDTFGESVALAGDYAIVGAPHEDGGDGNPLRNAGAAYVFRRTGENTWDSGTKVLVRDAQAEDQFGGSVAIGSDFAIVGAAYEAGGDSDPMPEAGAAYIYEY